MYCTAESTCRNALRFDRNRGAQWAAIHVMSSCVSMTVWTSSKSLSWCWNAASRRARIARVTGSSPATSYATVRATSRSDVMPNMRNST